MNSQVDHNRIVYDPKTDRKCCKNGAFTAVHKRRSHRIPISFSSVKRADIHFPPVFQAIQTYILFIRLNKYLLFNLSL
jgi:hypothetical protein